MGTLKRALLACLLAFPAWAETADLDVETAYEASQAAIGRQTSDHVLVDHTGQPLELAQLRGKPLLVSLVFTSCSAVCPLTTSYLRDQVEKARNALGEDSFNILTFGFDASGDRPAQLAAFAGTHNLTDIDGWHIASADAETTAAFIEELGFSYRAVAGSFFEPLPAGADVYVVKHVVHNWDDPQAARILSGSPRGPPKRTSQSCRARAARPSTERSTDHPLRASSPKAAANLPRVSALRSASAVRRLTARAMSSSRRA